MQFFANCIPVYVINNRSEVTCGAYYQSETRIYHGFEKYGYPEKLLNWYF